MWITRWMVDSMGEDDVKISVRFESAITAAEFIQMIQGKELTIFKSVFDFDTHGHPVGRQFKRMQFQKKALKSCLFVKVRGIDKTASIPEMLWKLFVVEPFKTDDDEEARILVGVKGVVKQADPKSVEILRLACQQQRFCEVTWSALQSDITDDLDGDGLLHLVRTGRYPNKTLHG